MNYLDELESEAIFIIREAWAQLGKCCILFSGGKDSITLTWLAKKAFSPARIPFDIVHIDTGHNFIETIHFRDEFVKEWGLNLVVGEVEKNILDGSAQEEHDLFPSRNRAQSVTLLETIRQYGYQAALGGGRRDEEKARAKERIFSHRDESGVWNPANQRPELWNMYNGLKKKSEHFRIFPLSNWTELDVWNYILREGIALPNLYFSHERLCLEIGNSLIAYSPMLHDQNQYEPRKRTIRFRTLGDITISGAIESTASNVREVIDELIQTRISERGYRMDDHKAPTAMENRKREGYF